MRMNSGTTPSWVGTAMVATTNTSRARRPRNRSLANANPARVEKRTTLIEVIDGHDDGVPQGLPELDAALITRETLSRKLPPGIRDGIGFWAMVMASEEPIRKDQ